MAALLEHMTGPALVDAAMDLIEKGDATAPQWSGESGYRVTGEMVAGHLESAADLMERENWDPQLYNASAGRDIWDALHTTGMDGRGDNDTRLIAGDLMDLVLHTATGVPRVDYMRWGQHPHTTLPQVLRLLRLTAAVARATGPTDNA